jgi:hypothetical protein
MRSKFLIVVFLLGVSPALAFDADQLEQGGSLQLSDLDPLIKQSAALKQDVSQALASIKKTADEVICTGNRFPREWVHLGGMRAAPYTCDFTGKWLVIAATVSVKGPNGQSYETITPAAMKNAVKVTETNPTWKWTTQDPNQ